jgi:hypothetical protein
MENPYLLRIIANVAGVKRNGGGWFRTSTGRSVCQGWREFGVMARRHGWLVSGTGTQVSSRLFVPGVRVDWRAVHRDLQQGTSTACRTFRRVKKDNGGRGL